MKRNKRLIYAIVFSFLFLMPAFLFKVKIEKKIIIYRSKIKECKVIKRNIEIRCEDLNRQNQQLREYSSLFTKFKSLKQHQIQWSKVIRQLAQNIPETIWIEKFFASRKNNNAQLLNVNNKGFNRANNYYDIWVDGKTTHPKHINTFAANLDTSVYFKDKSLEVLNSADLIWRFQIISNLKK